MSGGGFHKSGGGGHEGGGGEHVPLWYVSFSDMMAVLMSMFVMLYSMSNLDATKFQEVVVSLNGAYGVLSGGPGVLYLADLPTNLPTPGSPPVQISAMNVIRQKYGQELAKLASGGRIEAEVTDQGLKLRFTDRTLFDPGSATLKPGADEILHVVGEMLRDMPNRVAVEGHTDSTPISTPQFPSNWELSTARAASVIHDLIENEGIDPRRLTASGYGEYWPIVPNDTPERRAYNRRVEILILAETDHKPGDAPAADGQPAKAPGSHTSIDLLAIPKELGGAGQPPADQLVDSAPNPPAANGDSPTPNSGPKAP